MSDSDSDRVSGKKRANSAVSASDPRVFAGVFAEHAPHIWRAVRSLGVREADIEDVCQDVFVIVYLKLATFEGRSSLRSWIYGIALRVVADHRKKAYRVRERLVENLPEAVFDASQEQAAVQRQAWEKLDRLLDSLSEEQRRVFVLYELEQLSMREVASILECPLQTAYSRLAVAREVVQRGMAALRRQEQVP
jgi:RNA polymerase sigma-70 factor (ECF subfamily)